MNLMMEEIKINAMKTNPQKSEHFAWEILWRCRQ
jgi:hypothetical protein